MNLCHEDSLSEEEDSNISDCFTKRAMLKISKTSLISLETGCQTEIYLFRNNTMCYISGV